MSSQARDGRGLPQNARKAYNMNIVADIRQGDSCTIEFGLQIGNPKLLPEGFMARYCKKAPREKMSLRLVMFLVHCHHLVFGGYDPKVTHRCSFPYSCDEKSSLKYLDDILLLEDVHKAFDVLRKAGFYLWHGGGDGRLLVSLRVLHASIGERKGRFPRALFQSLVGSLRYNFRF